MSMIGPELDQRIAALSEAPETLERRLEALSAFRAQGFPTRKLEAWRYTDLKPVASGDWDFLARPAPEPVAPALAASIEHASLEGSAARLVFVDGSYVEALSHWPSSVDGLEIEIASSPHTLLGTAASGPAHALANLNAALAGQQVVLRLASRTEPLPGPIHLIFSAGAGVQRACQPRVAIELAAGTEATVVEHFLDLDDAAGWINVVCEASLAEDAKLSLYRVQEHGRDYLHTELLRTEIGARAALELYSLDLGGRLVRNDLEFTLTGREASVDLAGLFVAGAGQHIDNQTRIDHVGVASRSSEEFRGIADEGGRGIFNGKVVVHSGANGTDARQKSDNLLLGPRAEIDTKPELEIYTDEVKCSHGATVGELDPEELFYLRSRGLAEHAARSLLTFAFANRVLERLGLPALRARATEKIAGTLPESNHWLEVL